MYFVNILWDISHAIERRAPRIARRIKYMATALSEWLEKK